MVGVVFAVMIYTAPTTKYFLNDPKHFGCIFSVSRQVGGQILSLKLGCLWLFENARYTNRFNETKWIRLLQRFSPYKETNIGVAVPDIPYKAAETITEFWKYHHIPKMYGYKVAFVTQNGMTINDIPWSEIDTLFIGGDNKHKRGLEGQTLALEAKRLGKWVHVGRCNSGWAMLNHWTWADSADGTTFIKHPYQQLDSIKNGVETINNGTSQQLILCEV